MLDSVYSTILKMTREGFGVEQYPMSVYLNVLYQDYVDWEIGRKAVPKEIVELVQSLDRLPPIDRDRTPQQYIDRYKDMQELSAAGRTNASIGERWGITAPRVWQILHKAEHTPLRLAKIMSSKEGTDPDSKKDLLATVKRMGLSDKIQADITNELNSIDDKK